MILKNKTAVITGASDGIGKEIALKLAKEKVNLALIARSKDKLDAVKMEALKAGSSRVEVYPLDIKNLSILKKTIGDIVDKFKKIDILINDAGVWQKQGLLEEIDENVVDDVIQTNLIAMIHCTRLLLPNLKRQDESAIINISSRAGVLAQKGQSVYAASKWGVTGFTEVLKNDLKETGVRVAGIYQGGTNTRMFEKTGEDFPVKSFINPSDLADVVVFMLSRPKQIWLHDVRVEY